MNMNPARVEDSHRHEGVFLSAEWRDLVMLNYRVDPGLLRRYVPNGTELDFFDGSTFVSLVGFRFLRTKILGKFPFPFHSDFDEINLRFYIRRLSGNNCRRGVAFIREIVPRLLIARIARLVYGENYVCCPMRHTLCVETTHRTTQYEWQLNKKWSRLSAQASGCPVLPGQGTLEQFIAEHYWGYSSKDRSRTLEYRVSHVPWRVWVSTAAKFEGDGAGTYGEELGSILSGDPDSAFIAEGSRVLIHTGALV
jgi:uncharacterized protein